MVITHSRVLAREEENERFMMGWVDLSIIPEY